MDSLAYLFVMNLSWIFSVVICVPTWYNIDTAKGVLISRMDFMSMRDFRTQTTQVWDKLDNEEEIVITNNGRPRAFLINIPEGFFDEMLSGIRQARAQIKPKSRRQYDLLLEREQFDREHESEEMKISWQELKDMLAGIDGNAIDLKQLREERRAARYELTD